MLLKLMNVDGHKIAEVDGTNIISVTIERHDGYKMLQVETKEQVYFCDWISPVDSEVVEL